MSTYWLTRRLLLVAYTLLIVSGVIFALTQILPGDAAVIMLGETATPESLAALREQMGLNDPIWLQYWHWLSAVLHGDFGTSIRTGQAVGPTLLLALARSLTLALLAMIILLLVAVPLGVFAALRRGSASDLSIGFGSYFALSMPEFVTATILLIVIADYLQWLPATGYVPLTEDFFGGLSRLILPAIAVSLGLIAHVARMVRSEMIDVLHSDYIRAARLKGLSQWTVVFRHALPNALMPAITIIALDLGFMLGGLVVVEEIFAIPGLGRYVVTAMKVRDIPVIQAGVLFMAATYALVNLLADIAYAILDKRIRYD